MSEISYREALKILGLKGNPTDKEVRRAYLQLAKKWHPDVNSSAEAAEKFKSITVANMVVKRGPNAGPLSFNDLKFEYNELKKRIGPNPSFEDLQEAELALILKYKDSAEKKKKVEAARDYINYELNARQFLRERGRSIVVRRARRNLMTPDDKNAWKVQEINKQLQFQSGLQELKSNVQKRFKKLLKVLRVRKDAVYVPVVGYVKKKKVIQFVALSGALLGAIAAGKYLYDPKKQAFKPAGLLKEGKK